MADIVVAIPTFRRPVWLARLLRASELCARTDLKRLLTTLAELSPAHKECAEELRRKLERFEFADIHAALALASLAECP